MESARSRENESNIGTVAMRVVAVVTGRSKEFVVTAEGSVRTAEREECVYTIIGHFSRCCRVSREEAHWNYLSAWL